MQAQGAMSGMEGMNVMGDLSGISQDMSLEDGDYRDEYDDQAFADDSLGLSDARDERGFWSAIRRNRCAPEPKSHRSPGSKRR